MQIKYYQNWKTKGVDTDVIIDGVISHPKPHKNSEKVHPPNIEAGRERGKRADIIFPKSRPDACFYKRLTSNV